MKRSLLFIAILSCTISSFSQDKKQIKELSKKYNEYDQGPYKKVENVAILGTNLRFKVASHQAETNSWKDDVTYKFGAYATLEGIEDETFQEITNAYYDMLIAKFKELKINVVPYKAIEETKDFPKLKDKSTKENFKVKKSWGVTKTFNYDQHDYIVWNNAAPFGPQQKIAKEMKAMLFNSQVTIDFCHIGIDITQSGTNYYGSNKRVIYTEGKASVVPAIHITGYTYNSKGLDMLEDNTFNFSLASSGKQNNLILNLNISNIESATQYAISTDMCEGCTPEFAQGKIKLMEHTNGTVVIKADPVLFKKAVLEVLQQYLDEVFLIYSSYRM